MKTAKVLAPAKINLTLEILGESNGYHNLKSLVTTISLGDIVSVKLNNSGKITLKEKGIETLCEPQKNNAVRAVEEYIARLKDIDSQQYQNLGAKITVNKRIPLAGGLGGSSADVAGALNCMNKLLGGVDIYQIANLIGSDCAYMLRGGYAVISGRGEKIDRLENSVKLYFIIKTCKKGVSAGESYKAFDKLAKEFNLSAVEQKCVNGTVTEQAVSAIQNGDADKLLLNLSNDLTKGSIEILSEIGKNKELLSRYGVTIMCGSGSSVCAVFSKKAQRDRAYKQLKAQNVKGLIKAQTL